MGWIGWGAAREYVVIDPGQILPLPDGVREDAAAGLAVTYGTAFHAFLTRGRIQPGESVAVLGAAGGAGAGTRTPALHQPSVGMCCLTCA